MGPMRAPLLLCLTLAASALQAQTAPPSGPNSSSNSASTLQRSEQPAGRTSQRIERIQVEDAGSRIDELRVGGETRSITVQSAANVPAYEILPTDGARTRPQERDSVGTGAGQRVWNVFKF